MAEQEILAGFTAGDATVGITGACRICEQGTPYIVGVGLYDDEKQFNLGYIGEDGIEEGRDEDNTSWTPWQEFSPIREEITSSKVTFKFTLWQINGRTVAYFYGIDGSKIVTNPDGSWQFDEGGKPNIGKKQMYIDVVDKGRILRMVLSAAQISERGSIVYKSDEIIGFEITVTATPGPEGWSVRRIFYGYDLAGLEPVPTSPAPTMKTVTIGDATGGDFTLSFGGQTTAAIAYNATAATVKTALAGLSTIGTGKVNVTGSAGGPYSVVLDASLTGTLTADGTGLTGSGAAVTVA
ncbi:hypothetical protein [Gordonia sp. SND2]|uniref:phage tail tube protein n=1 Tax=Gordonia sp. SND2 TaxID=3388659 RepID=UPI00398B25C8